MNLFSAAKLARAGSALRAEVMESYYNTFETMVMWGVVVFAIGLVGYLGYRQYRTVRIRRVHRRHRRHRHRSRAENRGSQDQAGFGGNP